MEWWRDLFTTQLWQDVQLSWEEADDADADASLVVDALELRTGSRVLDAPCGTGRIAKRLCARGHDVVGLDATERFLAEAADAGVPVVRADMRASPVRRASFDAAFCLWGSFGYFDDEGNRAQARALADALRPAGRCLVDTIVADSLLPRFEPHATWEVAGVRGMPVPLVFEPTTEPKTSANRVHWDVTADVDELMALGATLVRPRDYERPWTVLADPEGNEFCAFPA